MKKHTINYFYEVNFNENQSKGKKEPISLNFKWHQEHIKLIHLIKQFPVIYSSRLRTGDWKLLENRAWEVIAKEIGISVLDSKIMWNNITSRYFAYKKKGSDLHEGLQLEDDPLKFLNNEERKEVLEISDTDSDTEKTKDHCVKTFVTADQIKNLLQNRNEEPSTSSNLNTQKFINDIIVESIHLFTPSTTDLNEPEPLTIPKTTEANISTTFTHSKSAKTNVPIQFINPTKSTEEHVAKQRKRIHSAEISKDIEVKKTKHHVLDVEYEEKDMKIFFKDLAQYISTKFSDKKQKALSLRICSLLTDAELQDFDNKID